MKEDYVAECRRNKYASIENMEVETIESREKETREGNQLHQEREVEQTTNQKELEESKHGDPSPKNILSRGTSSILVILEKDI
jgi:hypothetical protein